MNNIIKKILATSSLFFSFMLASCSSGGDTSENNILGIYKVSDRICQGSEAEVESCQAIIFVEFVKGNFYKVSDNEVAFVVWSGEKGKELTYTARKYEGAITFTKEPASAVISDDASFREEINFSEKTATYSYEKLQSGEPVKSQLKLNKAQTSDLAEYRMEYPGNN